MCILFITLRVGLKRRREDRASRETGMKKRATNRRHVPNKLNNTKIMNNNSLSHIGLKPMTPTSNVVLYQLS